MIDEQQRAFSAAAFADLHKAPEELYATELLTTRNDVVEAIDSTSRVARARA